MPPRIHSICASTNRYTGDEDLWYVTAVHADGSYTVHEVAPYVGPASISFEVQPDNTAMDGADDDRFVVEFRPWTPPQE